jgi:acyl dehydratase
MTIFDGPQALLDATGADLGTSDWIVIDQDRIDAFAEATGDHQWIHVDRERAATGPFGTTIAHGYLSLSLPAGMLGDLLQVPTALMGVNYGLDRVRFPTPVPSGSRVRIIGRVADATGDDQMVQVGVDLTVELEGADKPACAARMIARYYFGDQA